MCALKTNFLKLLGVENTDKVVKELLNQFSISERLMNHLFYLILYDSVFTFELLRVLIFINDFLQLNYY